MTSLFQSTSQRISTGLTGVPETLLGTLYSRAVDAKCTDSILNDYDAVKIVQQIDYDFSKMGVSRIKSLAISSRAKILDQWAAQFLQKARQQREPVTILHLACGLDTRALRLQKEFTIDDGLDVIWLDADVPDVIEVRRKLQIPAPVEAGAPQAHGTLQYRLEATDVTDENWVAKLGLPRDRKTFVVFEGLAMYLQPAQVRSMIEQLTEFFVAKGNEMAFDSINSFISMFSRFEPIIRRTGSSLQWTLDDPREVESYHQGLILREEVQLRQLIPPEMYLLTWCLWFASWIPVIRKSWNFLRYEW